MRRAATSLVLDVVGSAALLVVLALTWQSVRVHRTPPFGDVVADLSGRSLQPAAFGLGLVTLAGAVAALATRGWARRIVGAVVALSGAVVVAVALRGLDAVGAGRARSLVADAVAARTTGGVVVPITGGDVVVGTHPAGPVVAVVAALLIVAAGVLWTLPAPTSAGGPGGLADDGLGRRYEAPRAAERPREATLWSALDHGEDPTADPAADPAVGADVGSARPDPVRTADEHDLDQEPHRRTS